MQRIHNFFRFSKKIRFYVQSEINPQIKLTIDATEGEVLAKELKRHKVPLPFECGFSCSCSTCSVLIANSNDFSNIQIAQPQSQEEINVLATEGKGGRYLFLEIIQECVCLVKSLYAKNWMVLHYQFEYFLTYKEMFQMTFLKS